MGNSYKVMCYLCDGMDDLRKMKKFRGQYYHNVKIPTYEDTCLEAVKKNARRR